MATQPEPIEMRIAIWILALSFGAMLCSALFLHPAPAPWPMLVGLGVGIVLTIVGARKRARLKAQTEKS
jgi:hypothetical protein